ncbi:TetR/AcrR family transcriptional regulator [Phytohabitans sp. ZYX-F-186]|uniref:TetR/AcrR family transcriptional regulator n=1 Tax=Phytohabitans maris TaxID=3071409 RepID=A0ABU0Z9J8_9ACTN|nr:TetR/AcrR family transcriptional regulator [Phytohabitans sp. ZYX-F-186]MDQ7903715.1 TetR/AcrR family transcriptional regulator [Phytohabitans sp. ZYX-F-186]
MPDPTDRRQFILDTAAELFAGKGIAATTVREIAERVGMLSGSLYHHFASKDAIVNEIVSSYLTDLQAGYREAVATHPGPRERIAALVRVSLEVAQTHPHATEIYQNEFKNLRKLPGFEDFKAAAAEIQHTWLETLDDGVRRGALRADIPTRVFYRVMRDSLWLSVRWFRSGPDYDTERLADTFVTIFLDGYAGAGDRSLTGSAAVG